MRRCSCAASPRREALPAVLPARVLLPVGADRVELRAVPARGCARAPRCAKPGGRSCSSICGCETPRRRPGRASRRRALRRCRRRRVRRRPLTTCSSRRLAGGAAARAATRPTPSALAAAGRPGGTAAGAGARAEAAGGRCTRASTSPPAPTAADARRSNGRCRGCHRLAPAARRTHVGPGGLRGVVHLSSLDLAPFDAPEPVPAERDDRLAIASALHLVQALAGRVRAGVAELRDQRRATAAR